MTHYRDLGDLIELCILKQLALVFKKEFKELDLSPVTANLMSYLGYISKDESCPLLSKLVEYGLVEDLLTGLHHDSTIEQNLDELYLIGNMIGENGYIRNYFVKKGWVTVLLAFINTPDLPENLLEVFVWLIANTCSDYNDVGQKLPNNLSQIFTSILAKVLQDTGSEQIKRDGLYALINLGKRGHNPTRTIYLEPGLLNTVVSFLVENNQSIRSEAWTLLNLLSGTSLT